jgi:phage shock protein PspC (stress-responsive transcriptional regulator)
LPAWARLGPSTQALWKKQPSLRDRGTFGGFACYRNCVRSVILRVLLVVTVVAGWAVLSAVCVLLVGFP